MLKVLKFGGSSLADAKQYAKVKSIVEADPSRRVVVVSAAGKRDKNDHKITDLLYLCHAHIQYGVEADSVFEMIADRYRAIAADLNLKIDIDKELEQILDAAKNGGTVDELVSRGEYLSGKLMADFLGFEFLDSADWVRFRFDGSIDTEQSYELLRKRIGGKKLVIPGFYGAMPDGAIRLMSRGGSDITGALAAAALGADVYENWTDVSGILMADPRIVKNPKPVERVTYDELRELSFMGANVLHEGTILPVKLAGIPLNVRNTNEPSHPGTVICEKFEELSEENEQFITGIAGRKNFSIINIAKNGMSGAVGMLRQILEIFENHKVSIEHVPSGIDTVSVVVSSEAIAKSQYSILGEIEKTIKPEKITVTDNISIVAVVGRKMAFRPGMSGKLFATLGEAGVNIRMISQGPDELNIIVGIDNKDFNKAIEVLYSTFVR